MATLTEIIHEHVDLSKQSPSGWYTLKCPVCNDYKKRGGFKFENNIVSYNCFNCSTVAVYTEGSGKFSTQMKNVLSSFNITTELLGELMLDGLKTKKITITKKSDVLYPAFIALPDHFYKLNELDNVYNQLAVEYLQSRCIDANKYQFYLSDDKLWKGRIIIPFYWRHNIIYYQGRNLLNNGKQKYLNSPTSRDSVLFNMDMLNNEVVYIMEGVFDALSVDGVAVTGNRFTQQQINILNRSTCEKIYIPDKFGGDIDKSVDNAISAGCKISLPDIGRCKDINEAVCQYGKLYVLKTIKDNIISNNDLVKIKLKLYTKQ